MPQQLAVSKSNIVWLTVIVVVGVVTAIAFGWKVSLAAVVATVVVSEVVERRARAKRSAE